MKFGRFAIVFFLTTGMGLLSNCQSENSKNQTQGLQQQLAEQKEILEKIQSDVEVIKKAVDEARRPQQARERPVSIDDDFIKGRSDAKITIIEFSDFQCPFCARFYQETLPFIDREYIQTGKARLVYRDFPLDTIHKDAQKAAEAAQCAGEQGKFWEMHDKLFENQKALGPNHLKRYAKEIGLPMTSFNECLDSGKYAKEVQKDLRDGQEAGVSGTPSFFIGFTGPDKTIQGFPLRGAVPYSTFKQTLDRLLEGKQNP